MRDHIAELREMANEARRDYGTHSSRAAELDELALRLEEGLGALERELEEAEEAEEQASERYAAQEYLKLIAQDAANTWRRQAEAAEARLATVAREFEKRPPGCGKIWVKAMYAALSAPAEERPPQVIDLFTALAESLKGVKP